VSTLQSALGYAERLGAAVIPTASTCKPGTVPKFGALLDGLTEDDAKAFASHDGTKDPALIRSIWTRFPKANVSMCTGAISGFFVLDIDAKDGKVDGFASLAALEAENGALPRTWRALTPSGGEHRYFRQPDGWTLRNKVGLRTYDSKGRVIHVFAGLDIRTDGGAIAAPPSEKANGSYRWAERPIETPLADAPLWLLRLAMDPPAPPKPDRAPLRRDTADRMARYVEKAIDGECGELSRMGKGTGRNLRLFQAACRLGSLVGAHLLPQDLAEAELTQAASQCGLLAEDGAHSVRLTIQSGMRKGIANPREVARS
jgi:hypothetical protein